MLMRFCRPALGFFTKASRASEPEVRAVLVRRAYSASGIRYDLQGAKWKAGDHLAICNKLYAGRSHGVRRAESAGLSALMLFA